MFVGMEQSRKEENIVRQRAANRFGDELHTYTVCVCVCPIHTHTQTKENKFKTNGARAEKQVHQRDSDVKIQTKVH